MFHRGKGRSFISQTKFLRSCLYVMNMLSNTLELSLVTLVVIVELRYFEYLCIFVYKSLFDYRCSIIQQILFLLVFVLLFA